MAEKDLKALIEECLRSLDPTVSLSPGSPAQTKVVSRILNFVGADPFSTDFLSYAQLRIAETYPQLAQEPGDPLSELLITPGTALLEPIAREVWNVRLRQDLSNLDYHTEESLDAAVSNLYIERNPGEYALGTVRVYFAAPRYAAFTMEKMFSTSDGLNFYPASNQYITATQMVYNKEGEYYYFDVRCIAQYAGEEYNVSPNKIVSVAGIDGVVKVANKTKFRSGVARETNEQLWSRAAQFPNEAAANTYRGIFAVLRDNVPAITYFQMIGYGDEEMTRDMITGGGYGPLVDYATTFSCVEDGDYDMSSDRIYVDPANWALVPGLGFLTILGSSGVPRRPAMLSIYYTPPGGVPTQADFEVVSVLDDNTVQVDSELRMDGVLHHVALRYKTLTISGMPLHAYPDSFVSFQVFNEAHIGGVMDVWAKDPEPTEGEVVLPSISDETYFHQGGEGALDSALDASAIYLYDVDVNEYYSGTNATAIGVWVNILDIASGQDPVPMELQVGDLLYVETAAPLSNGYYPILEVDISAFQTGGPPPFIRVNIGVPLGVLINSYKLVDFSRQFSKGWIVKLEEGEAGLYKMEKIENCVHPTDRTKAGAKVITGATFGLIQPDLDYKVYDNFEINLIEPKNIRIEAADLICLGGAHLATSATGLDFEVLGVAEGDILRVTTGPNAGDYPIVRYAGATNSDLSLSVATPYADINASYMIFEPLTPLELPLVRVADVALVDASESTVNIPCADVLTCVSRGISNMDSGTRLRTMGVQVGLVGSVDGSANYPVDTMVLALKIRRRLMLAAGLDEQVQSIDVTFAFASLASPDLTLAEVVDQINTAIGLIGPIAQAVDDHLVLAPLADEGILIDAPSCTAGCLTALGITNANCAISMTAPYMNHYVSYGMVLINDDRPLPMGESDYIYFETGSNAGAILQWRELSVAKHVLFDPFCGVRPQPPWEANSVLIGYPSTGYFRCYFKEPTKVTVDRANEIVVEDDDGVERTYIPAPRKYALLSPADPDTDRWEATGMGSDAVSGTSAIYLTEVGVGAVRGLLPREFGESEYSLLSPRTDVFVAKYRRVWFKDDVSGGGPYAVLGETLSLAVENGPLKTVTFAGAGPLTPQEIIDQINAVWSDIAELDEDSGPSSGGPGPSTAYICLRSQYLISGIVASAGLTAALGALVPPLATTNKSYNYGAIFEAPLVSLDTDFCYLDPGVTLLPEGRYTPVVTADSELDDGLGMGTTLTGDPKIQYELRRYGAQRCSSYAMNSNEYLGYYYADFEYISLGIGDSFNQEAEVTGEMAGSPALGYTLETHEPLAFSTMEPVRMIITPTVSEVDVTSKASDDRVLSDDLKIDYLYSEVVADAHNVLVQELERILCGSIACKHMIPYFVNADLNYTGGPSRDDALDRITELIEGLREGERIEVSDITNLLTMQGASYVQTPVVLALLAQDTERKQKLYLIEDASSLPRLAAFFVLSLDLVRS